MLETGAGPVTLLPNHTKSASFDGHINGSPKRHSPAPSFHLPILLRRIIQDPLRLRQPRYLLAGVAFILFLIFVFLRRPPPALPGHIPLQLSGDARNWGDYVARGLARAKVLDSTPTSYADLGDRRLGGGGPLYAARRARGELPPPTVAKGGSVTSGKDSELDDRDFEYSGSRHGVLGGASTEWSTGVLGGGDWLGETVDMRKDSPGKGAGKAEEPLSGRQALTDHILQQGWLYLDAEDKENSEKLLIEARRDDWLDQLPLRDQVRGDEVAMREAAEGWSRVYGAMEGQWRKSALEIAVEKLVRRVPLVVFSKTTCPHSTRVKVLLQKYQLSPEAHVVEVDLRPDSVNLKGLLARRTNHATFPNVIIGSRSIGGADDLEKLDRDGELVRLLEESLITVHLR